MQFIKHTQNSEDAKVTFYSPVEASNTIRYSHVVGTFTNPETKEVKEYEFLSIEHNILAEQPFSVPLKAMKRVKQTKTEEIFQVEETVKVMQPLMQRMDNKEEIDVILSFLNANLVGHATTEETTTV